MKHNIFIINIQLLQHDLFIPSNDPNASRTNAEKTALWRDPSWIIQRCESGEKLRLMVLRLMLQFIKRGSDDRDAELEESILSRFFASRNWRHQEISIWRLDTIGKGTHPMLSGTLISHFLCFSIGFPMVWVTNILNHFFFDQEVATETLRNLLGVLVSTNILGFMPKVPEKLMMGVEADRRQRFH